MYHSLSIHLMKDILIASMFQQLWIKLLSASICRLLCRHEFSTPLGKYQGVGWLDCIVRVCLVLLEINKLSSNLAILCVCVCVFIFTRKNESLCCFTSLPAFSAISFLDFCHSNWCVVVFHCCLIFIALMTSDVELLFICLLPSVYFL